MTTINTNIAAMTAANSIKTNDRSMAVAMERLSTGLRINSASDDAAGLAISTKMTSQIRGLDAAARNANDAISMIQVADGAASEITDMLQRMRELTVQSSNGVNSTTDRANLDQEFVQLALAIDKIAETTEFNGRKILNGSAGGVDVAGVGVSTVTFQVGANSGANEQLTVDFSDFNLAAGAAGTPMAADLSGFAVGGIDESAFATTLDQLDAALEGVASQRATFGAAVNTLEHTVDNLVTTSGNQSAARSQILDADYAAETTALARTQIISQAGTAMLSQANQAAQGVLALLR